MSKLNLPAMLDEKRAKYVNREIEYEQKIKSLHQQVNNQAVDITLLRRQVSALEKQDGEFESLRQQLSTLKGEIKLIGEAIDDPRVDLTMTMSEVIVDIRQQLELGQAMLAGFSDRVDALEQQLANSQKQEVMLRKALKHMRSEYERYACPACDEADEALSATADLDKFVLCEKEPVAYTPAGFCDDGEPLYRAKEQGK